MPYDAIIRIYSNRGTRQGSAIVSADKLGGVQVLLPTNNQAIPVSGISEKLDIRFDDPSYYNA